MRGGGACDSEKYLSKYCGVEVGGLLRSWDAVLALIQIPQVWIPTTILSWLLLGKKASGGQEWGLVLRVTKLVPTGKSLRSCAKYAQVL